LTSTTIISLIPRFYDPSAGAIKIDGWDVRSFTQKSLRKQISFVLQETMLFNAPVWENIAYGKPEAGCDEIMRAAQLANAHEFILKLPDAYNTLVGERGVTLSGGQRQRIAIARAIIRNAPILILDEPSSGLDAASEKLVFEALDRLMEGKTSIVIAHRLSTIRRADISYVVKDGSIVEQGRHEDLLNLNGLYAEHYRLQFLKEEDALEADFVPFPSRMLNFGFVPSKSSPVETNGGAGCSSGFPAPSKRFRFAMFPGAFQSKFSSGICDCLSSAEENAAKLQAAARHKICRSRTIFMRGVRNIRNPKQEGFVLLVKVEFSSYVRPKLGKYIFSGVQANGSCDRSEIAAPGVIPVRMPLPRDIGGHKGAAETGIRQPGAPGVLVNHKSLSYRVSVRCSRPVRLDLK
jgi:ABC-type multidrug transport system ATPase subunit